MEFASNATIKKKIKTTTFEECLRAIDPPSDWLRPIRQNKKSKTVIKGKPPVWKSPPKLPPAFEAMLKKPHGHPDWSKFPVDMLKQK